MKNPNSENILDEIELINDMSDQRVVESIRNRLMLCNTWNGANKEIFEAAKRKGII